MLRSRGAGSNATGPCDPFQMAASCNCSSSSSQPLPANVGLADDYDRTAMPKCIPSPFCGIDDVVPSGQLSAPPRVAILLFMAQQAQSQQYQYVRGRPEPVQTFQLPPGWREEPACESELSHVDHGRG